MIDTPNPIRNIFSVDLEDWFCVANMERAFPFRTWEAQELRLGSVTGALLQILKSHRARATFFVLGWIAEQRPDLVREIADAGHEIALHGYAHRRLTVTDPQAFAEDVALALEAVSKAVPQASIVGYRAPSFTLTPKTSWALDILAQQGLRYDSSIVPVSWGWHPDYGWKGASPAIRRLENGLIEVPPTAGLGGGYFRLFPYSVTRALIRRINSAGRPAVFYIHPWELDIDQPRIALPYAKRFRHYVNLNRTAARLERLLTDFSFGTVSEVLEQHGFQR